MGQTLGLRTFATAKVRARARSNRGGVVSSVAVLLRCLFSKAEFRVAWQAYGVIVAISDSRRYRSCFMAFSVRYGWVVILCMAVSCFRSNHS